MHLKKRTLFSFCSLFILCIWMTSCAGIDSDAKKAAKLTNKSIEQTSELKFDEAKASFEKAQQIIHKYEQHKKSAEFQELYKKYRDENRIFPKP